MIASSLGRRRAFTLVELQIVLVVVAVLIAFASPALRNQSSRAADLEAQAAVALAHRSATAFVVANDGTYGGVPWYDEDAFPTTWFELNEAASAMFVAELLADQPSLRLVADRQMLRPDGRTVLVEPMPSFLSADFCAQSRSGRVYCLRHDADGGMTPAAEGDTRNVSRCTGSGAKASDDALTCLAEDFSPGPDRGPGPPLRTGVAGWHHG